VTAPERTSEERDANVLPALTAAALVTMAVAFAAITLVRRHTGPSTAGVR
jgi:hypothetical protein